MNRRRLLLALLGGCGLLAVTWLAWPQRLAPQQALLKDGSSVTIVAVTYGKKHEATLGTLKERLTRQLPAKLFPKWPRALSLRTNTERDTLVVWLFSTNSLAFNHYFVAGFVAGSNGVELQTSRILAQGLGRGKGVLIGMAVDAFPRQEESFTLRLRSLMSPQDTAEDYPPVAGLTVQNPARSQTKPWRAPPLPQQVVTKEFECELEKCRLNLAKGLGIPLSIRLRFLENGSPVEHWRVQKVELEDATGNFLVEPWGMPMPIDSTPPMDNEFRRSLLPGVGAWKLRAYVMRTAGFPSNELWEVRDMPVLGQPGHGRQLWRTNFAGALLEVGPPGATGRNRWVASLGGRVSGEDWVVLSCDSQDVLERLQLITLEDNRGFAGSNRGTMHGDHVTGWGPLWSAGATSATIRVGVSHWRVVEFLVEPKVVGAKR